MLCDCFEGDNPDEDEDDNDDDDDDVREEVWEDVVNREEVLSIDVLAFDSDAASQAR